MNLNGQIVIIEDEKEIAALLNDALTQLGLKTHIYHDGKEALEFIQSNRSDQIDLFILDRMLPSINGIEICKFIRMFNTTKLTPILMVTALSTPEQIVEGLDAGADDYITKPFDLVIFQARVRSLLRRKGLTPLSPTLTNTLKHKDLFVDLDQCKTTIQNMTIDLTLSEFKLLTCFLQNPGKVLTRNQLVEYIQEGPVHVTDRTIDTHVFGLRKKLGDYSNIIETIRGVGYRVISVNE